MVCFKFSSSVLCLLAAGSLAPTALARLHDRAEREPAERIRNPNSETVQSAAMKDLPIYSKFFKSLGVNPYPATKDFASMQTAIETELDKEKVETDALVESFQQIVDMGMSMPPTPAPTISSRPSTTPSGAPSDFPSASPTVSAAPTTVTPAPTVSAEPTSAPTAAATASPTVLVVPPSASPTLANCGISADERVDRILAILDANAEPSLIRNNNVPQGQATTWLLDLDEAQICPDDPKILQRWSLAVVYFSTGGDDWFQCSGSADAVDNCGGVEPFVGDTRFLDSSNECSWAGISCIDGCVTEIEFGTYITRSDACDLYGCL